MLRYGAPVAVCTLNSASLAARLEALTPEGLAIAGTMHTENLGIERIIKNTITNPHIRFLVLCGEDTRQAIGHLPGQSLQSLLENGVDERGRIIGARGKRPVLKNVTPEEIECFRRQGELVARIGEEREEVIAEEIGRLRARDPGPAGRECGRERRVPQALAFVFGLASSMAALGVGVALVGHFVALGSFWHYLPPSFPW